MCGDIASPHVVLRVDLLGRQADIVAAKGGKAGGEAPAGEFLPRDGPAGAKHLQGFEKAGIINGLLAAHDGIVVIEHETAIVQHRFLQKGFRYKWERSRAGVRR